MRKLLLLSRRLRPASAARRIRTTASRPPADAARCILHTQPIRPAAPARWERAPVIQDAPWRGRSAPEIRANNPAILEVLPSLVHWRTANTGPNRSPAGPAARHPESRVPVKNRPSLYG